jgi:hypothetical protein
MIKLTLHLYGGSKSMISFANLTQYTNWVIFNSQKFHGLERFEVTEGPECRHVWSVRNSDEVRFEFTCAYGCGETAFIEQDEITALKTGRQP